MSKTLVDIETRHSQVEHTVLALCVAAKKPHPYFQAHPVTILTILTNQPLKVTLHKLYLSGWMMKWAIELIEYGIQYKPCLSLKGKILVDFIAELHQKRVQIDTINHWWILHIDGTS